MRRPLEEVFLVFKVRLCERKFEQRCTAAVIGGQEDGETQVWKLQKKSQPVRELRDQRDKMENLFLEQVEKIIESQ